MLLDPSQSTIREKTHRLADAAGSPIGLYFIAQKSRRFQKLPETTPNGDNQVIKILLVDDQTRSARRRLRMRLELEPDLTIVREAYVVVKIKGRVPVKEN
jgi:hypothetical protein